MTENVVPFRRPALSADAVIMEIGWGEQKPGETLPLDLSSFAYPGGGPDLHGYLADRFAKSANFDAAVEGMGEARSHLIEASDGIVTGTVTVSASALHFVLGFLAFVQRTPMPERPAA